ncbi:hypothetical protein PPYR_00544 [Photinus pyralis]|uniref:Cysteine-rich DPF motif domain-containing protein 1 n=1 Tax=Photinus pyralis TaxID=7054 RepID=A0A1Y1MJW7_PHOPY|nr:hypothetical protein PPYR_00544 [Photinus pyralis]
MSGEDEKQPENTDEAEYSEEKRYFSCKLCNLHERYDYFGKSPEFVRNYKLKEDSYVLEDPFAPPKRGEYLILGAHCVQCKISVCKDSNCSFYINGTYCMPCAKSCRYNFPKLVQEKLNRII